MELDLILVLALLAAAILMFSLGKPRADAVALLAIVALPFTGTIGIAETLAGFGSPIIVLIAAMFVIGESLARTGIAQRMGDWLVARGGQSEVLLLILLMSIVGLLGSVMYSSGVIAIFIPIALRIARNVGIAPSQLLMPVSFAALMSGMLTLIAASPNLIVNDELIRAGTEGFSFFTLTPFGVPIMLLGIAYMVAARRWLGPAQPAQPAGRPRPRLIDWVRDYRLAEREYRVRVLPESPLVGRRLETLRLPEEAGVQIVALERSRRFRAETIRPVGATEIEAEDVLLIDSPAPIVDADDLCERYALERLPLSGVYFTDRSQEVGMAEAILPAESRFAGKTIVASRLRSRYDLTAVGLRRGPSALEPRRVAAEPLRPGDTLLLVGSWKAIGRLQADGHDLIPINLPRELDEVLPAAARAPYALFALLLTVGAMVSGLLPTVQAALIGCLLMGLFRCIDLDSAYRAISLRSLVTIAGMLPFAVALDRTGGIDLAAGALIAVLGDAGPYAVLATLYLIAVLLGLFIVAAANAVLVIPVALAVAAEMGASPYPFAIIVALGASSPFMTPIAPANAMVATAGNYRFRDFVRVGLPLVGIVLTVALVMVPWLYPLY